MSTLTVTAIAQPVKVNIIVDTLPETPLTDAVYLTGNFNNWNPQQEKFRLQKNKEGCFSIELNDAVQGVYECKFTRGGWNNAETDSKGADITNRIIIITGNNTLYFSIAGWKDGFNAEEERSTASPQVTVMDTAFEIPQLNTSRRVWIYLPADYGTAVQKKYPVLYMHDGQNLFDDATSFAGEWAVDETMDAQKNACIVVGIDNGGIRRMNEYNPNTTKQFGKGQGKDYLDFIVKNLKPFIDTTYRTLPAKQTTYMAGSSMGALISFYAGLYYPDVFGVLGIFSPSFWIVPDMKMQVEKWAKKAGHGSQQYYFYAGGAEDKRMAQGMEAIAAVLKATANPAMLITVNPLGKHNEPSWRKAFPLFYEWIGRQEV